MLKHPFEIGKKEVYKTTSVPSVVGRKLGEKGRKVK